MALPLNVDKLDAIPEAHRGLYVADGDKFKLDVDGIEDTTGLKSALAAERALNKTHKAELAAWKKAGKTPDEIAELVAAQDAAAAELAKKSGNFDTILKQHQDKWTGEKTTLEKERDEARSATRGALVDSALLGALTKAKATPEGVDLLTERLSRRVQLEFVGGKPVHKIMQADGTSPMAGSGSDGLATYDDLVKEAVKNYPSQFEGTGAGGGGTPPKGGTPGGKTMTRKDFDALGPADRIAKIKAGVKVVE